MRSIAELSRGISTLSVDPNTTKTATTGITSMRPTKWSSEVIKFSEALRMLDQIVYVTKALVGTKDAVLTIPTQESHLSIDTSPVDTTYPEGTVREMTIMDNTGTVSFTIAATDFLKGAVAIGKEVFMTCAVDLITEARYYIAEDLADDVDLALATALQSASVTNQLWGGDATQVEDLTAGDVITTDLFVDGMTQLEVNNFVPKAFVCSPYQKATFMKDSQFVNASEYGSNEIIMKGEIGSYLSVKIIVTTNANMYYTTGDTETNEAASPGAISNTCIMVGDNKRGQKCSVGLAWKEMPHIDYEYQKNEARHLIYYDQAFTTSLIHLEAISLIKVTTV